MVLAFWLSLLTLLYIYIGYPLLVWTLAMLVGHEPTRGDMTPTVSLLIPAYNEAAHIQTKLENSLALNYPKERFEIVVASDGSTDGTNAIVERYRSHGVVLHAMPTNMGKAAMLSQVVPLLHGEMVVFSDASSELAPDALRVLLSNFADPHVGCVSGLYRLLDRSDLRAEGEGLYWRYETFIKQQESRLHSILGAHGAFYAIRKGLFQDVTRSVINDDYLIPMRAVAQGYRAVYEPRACAWERETSSVESEFARRRRIAAGNCQQMIELRQMLSPRYGWVAFCFFSHKVLRTVAPFFMLFMLLATFWLPQPFLLIFITLQSVLYVSAWIGYLCQRQGRAIRWLSPPLYFCLGNLAMLDGLLKYCFNRRRLAWGRVPARP